jgi:hypothetical protein
MVTLLTMSSFFSTCTCFLRGGWSPFEDLPPLSLVCGWPPGANGSLPVEWRRLQGFRVEDPLGARKGGPNRPPEGLGRPAWADRPRPISARFGRPFTPVGPQVIMHFGPSTCMILTMSSSRPRWRFSSHEVRSFTLQSSGVFLVALRSSPPLEVISSSSWHEQDSVNAPLNLLRIRPLCPCFPT